MKTELKRNPHRWRKANLLSEADMPVFREAAMQAAQMPNRQWIHWLNHIKGYNYSFLCKMAKEVNLCTPGHAFYPKMRTLGLRLLKQEDTDDLLWRQD